MGLFDKLRQKPAESNVASYTPGKRMYCIGDIHGRGDLLDELHAKIAADADGYEGERQVLYLGDFIDRGPDSREVVETLVQSPLDGFETIHLVGNHEYAILNFLDDPEQLAGWLGWGGRETLLSYGIYANAFPSKDDLFEIRDQLSQKLPTSHLAFLESCQVCYQEGDYYFVHAGIRPGVPLDRQDYQDQLWIRDAFTQSSDKHGAVIVHGHTITPEPELLPNRIGLDTGAYASGVLTCLVLEGERQRFLQTGNGSC